MGTGSPEMTSAHIQLKSAGRIPGEGVLPLTHRCSNKEKVGKYFPPKQPSKYFSSDCSEAPESSERNLITCKNRRAPNRTASVHHRTTHLGAKSSPDKGCSGCRSTFGCNKVGPFFSCPNKDKINYYSLQFSNKCFLYCD